MKTRTYDCAYGCPVEATLDVIGGKWKGVLLYHLLNGPKRFGEFQRLLPNLTHRVLTLQLRELEEAGVIQRRIFNEIPPHVEYSLTIFGKSLEPILLLMRDWGDQYRQSLLEKKDPGVRIHDTE
jgi:DNA-binding HxlR family transcriptional regulator